MNEWNVVENALRPYLRRKRDDESAARDVIRDLAAAGFVLVELPAPTDLGDYGAVWDAGQRHPDLPTPEYGGPIGTVQYRPDTGRIEVRDDLIARIQWPGAADTNERRLKPGLLKMAERAHAFLQQLREQAHAAVAVGRSGPGVSSRWRALSSWYGLQMCGLLPWLVREKI